MNIGTRESVVIGLVALLALVLPSFGVWLLTRGHRLRTGCLGLPLLILPGWFAINYYHVEYDDPRQEADAEAHRDPGTLLDYDPIGGNLAVLIVSWVPPTAVGLFTLVVLGFVRHAKDNPNSNKPGPSLPPA